MAPVDTVPGLDVTLLSGPLVLGYMWGYGLFGVLTVQMYIYYIFFNSKDNWKIRLYVWFIYVLELAFTILSTIAAWHQYGPGWGDINSLLFFHWSWEVLPSLNGTISAMVQTFYVWRIYNLTKNVWIPLLIELVAVVQCVLVWHFGIAVAVEGHAVDKLIGLSAEISAWLAGSAACDVMITSALVFVLYRKRSQSNFSGTTSVVTKLIRFTVETGLLTSAAAIVELVLWLILPEYNIHLIGFLVLAKLYSNALVASLNSRALIFGSLHAGAYTNSLESSGPPTSNLFWDEQSNSQTQTTSTTSQAMHIARTTETHNDSSHEMVVVPNWKHAAAGDTEIEANNEEAKHNGHRVHL
ncbi:hypothetical protein EV421DRAFT_125377 [Armillaria borealis]|uniref:DUF6534 domain-containing protein n=1 Tax=Armillaria borealis TaxID=47425 RepID=A0AA39IYQ1_9AGAR|nr:hypothetical protein EV421DRAFT_125377 [Armillaria borealis]